MSAARLRMLRQTQQELSVSTHGRGFYPITDFVQNAIKRSGMVQGLAVLHLQHTSASLLIQENADPDVRVDLENFFARLVPDGAPAFIHTTEGPDDMPAHIRAALTAVTLSIPFARSALALGVWQGVYLWEHRTLPHQRRIILHLLGD
jgi:secondary thiamine-phosphate synthase enzyme